MKQAIPFLLISVTFTSLMSCTNNPDAPRLATGGMNGVNSRSAESNFALAKSLESSGKTGKAIKAYENTAENFPLSSRAAEARFRQASLLYASGQLVDSFKAYQTFIEKHNSSKLYSEALSRQYAVAIAAAKGSIKHNFMGLKSKHAATTCEKMLRQCKTNGPFSSMAPKAQYSIGELWESRKTYSKAISGYKEVYNSYPDSSLAPEAMYKVGTLLMLEAKNGNRNKASLDTAKNAFLDLQQMYPNHPRAKDARVKLSQLDVSNVQRSFDNAEFYRGKGQNQAAIIYYQDVIKASPSGRLHNLAKKRLAELGQ